jgi:hypothetical protein
MKNSPPGSGKNYYFWSKNYYSWEKDQRITERFISLVKSAHSGWKNVSSDLGSSVVSCPDAVLMSRQKKDSIRSDGENELIEGLTGEKLIKILVSFTVSMLGSAFLSRL